MIKGPIGSARASGAKAERTAPGSRKEDVVRIGKLFHLTMLVDEFDRPQRFFNGVFSPICVMHGYSSHWNRDAAIYIIAETSIEPMHVFPPKGDEPATSWFRFMDRYGPRVHNLAFF